MIDMNSIEVVTADPENIHRKSNVSMIRQVLTSLKVGEAALVTSDTKENLKTDQRNINALMKTLKSVDPHKAYVTRTVTSDTDDFVLGVYRIS